MQSAGPSSKEAAGDSQVSKLHQLLRCDGGMDDGPRASTSKGSVEGTQGPQFFNLYSGDGDGDLKFAYPDTKTKMRDQTYEEVMSCMTVFTSELSSAVQAMNCQLFELYCTQEQNKARLDLLEEAVGNQFNSLAKRVRHLEQREAPAPAQQSSMESLMDQLAADNKLAQQSLLAVSGRRDYVVQRGQD